MSAASTTGRAVDGGFLRTRLGSFLAVMPLSVWTINHLWNNLSAFKGAAAWQSAVTEYPHPLAFFATSVVALVPLGLHTVWGVGRLFTGRPNNLRYNYFANLKYLLQRLSALGLLGFLGAHLWLAMIKPRTSTGRPEMFADIAHEMHHHGPTLVVYMLGILAVAYHLANGLQTFLMSWGIVSSRRALKKLDLATIGAFLALLALGWTAVYALWDAGT